MEDILTVVFTHLTIIDIYSCMLVNKEFMKASKYPFVWLELLEKNYKGEYDKQFKGSFCEIYKLCFKLQRVRTYLKLNDPINVLYNMEVLYLSNNKLTTLPQEIINLKNTLHYYKPINLFNP